MPIDPTIPFGEFAPDKTPYYQGILNDVKNALPQGTHYSSCKDLSAMSSNALPSNPLGAIAFKNFNNNTKIYVGSKSALYEYNNGGFNDVSTSTSFSKANGFPVLGCLATYFDMSQFKPRKVSSSITLTNTGNK